MTCVEALDAIQLRPQEARRMVRQGIQPQVARHIDLHPALGLLRPKLLPHSGFSSELLQTSQGCQQLYDRLDIQSPPRPRPADWSIRHTSEARCKVCLIYEHDRMERSDNTSPEETVQKCPGGMKPA